MSPNRTDRNRDPNGDAPPESVEQIWDQAIEAGTEILARERETVVGNVSPLDMADALMRCYGFDLVPASRHRIIDDNRDLFQLVYEHALDGLGESSQYFERQVERSDLQSIGSALTESSDKVLRLPSGELLVWLAIVDSCNNSCIIPEVPDDIQAGQHPESAGKHPKKLHTASWNSPASRHAPEVVSTINGKPCVSMIFTLQSRPDGTSNVESQLFFSEAALNSKNGDSPLVQNFYQSFQEPEGYSECERAPSIIRQSIERYVEQRALEQVTSLAEDEYNGTLTPPNGLGDKVADVLGKEEPRRDIESELQPAIERQKRRSRTEISQSRDAADAQARRDAEVTSSANFYMAELKGAGFLNISIDELPQETAHTDQSDDSGPVHHITVSLPLLPKHPSRASHAEVSYHEVTFAVSLSEGSHGSLQIEEVSSEAASAD